MQVGSTLSRRRALFSGFCLCCLPRLGRAAPADEAPFAMEEIVQGLFFQKGLVENATAANQDAIANTGFVVGRDCVAVIDPGGDLACGRRLRAAVRAATSLPIRYVVLTHVHPDHHFGAGAFLPDAPVFVGHARLPQALASRGTFYQAGLDDIVGAGQAGPVVPPTLLVSDGAKIDLGGRVLSLHAHGPAHTDNDLSVLDEATGTLMSADLVFADRVPSLDGDLRGWLKELAVLKAMGAARVVPGHGLLRLSWDEASWPIEGYLRALLDQTRAAIRDGVPIEQAVGTVAAGERARWALFDDYNGRNVTEAYKELEWE
ncbi:MAG: quinoprotein relay system zinc metallohydrolase 2 [Janthinobacterium lividum]